VFVCIKIPMRFRLHSTIVDNDAGKPREAF